MVDKVSQKLQSWDTRTLSMAGRITLAQSVLLSIQNFFMQSLMILRGVCLKIEKLVRHFIWGCTDNHPKMSLVGWDSIYQPRARGGLGFRNLEDRNKSFLMKIGFILVSKSDALWVRVLRFKCSWKDQISNSISKNQCSHLWRALAKIWPLFCENLIWSLGDSSTVRCWNDPWISDGSWNLDLFCVWLSAEVICRIISIPPLHSDSGSDSVIWARSSSGAFSTRSAYWTLKEPYWHPPNENWKFI
ncbi:hypothetical protein V6Z11_A10G235500 [Gossypium hirsutum]